MSEPEIHWDKGWHGITGEHRARWRKAYPALKIDTELAEMDQWLWANPNRRKKNYPRFIVNWLNNRQKTGGAILNRLGRMASSYNAHCSGNYRAPEPLTQAEIAKRVAENKKPGGNCDQVAAFLTELGNGQPQNQSESVTKN